MKNVGQHKQPFFTTLRLCNCVGQVMETFRNDNYQSYVFTEKEPYNSKMNPKLEAISIQESQVLLLVFHTLSFSFAFIN